jgi:hypothetical protein
MILVIIPNAKGYPAHKAPIALPIMQPGMRRKSLSGRNPGQQSSRQLPCIHAYVQAYS